MEVLLLKISSMSGDSGYHSTAYMDEVVATIEAGEKNEEWKSFHVERHEGEVIPGDRVIVDHGKSSAGNRFTM